MSKHTLRQATHRQVSADCTSWRGHNRTRRSSPPFYEPKAENGDTRRISADAVQILAAGAAVAKTESPVLRRNEVRRVLPGARCRHRIN